jgi:hypothetical protein
LEGKIGEKMKGLRGVDAGVGGEEV